MAAKTPPLPLLDDFFLDAPPLLLVVLIEAPPPPCGLMLLLVTHAFLLRDVFVLAEDVGF